jgi:ElaA protein
MEFITKTFLELTTIELYQILELRSEVFVVEQDCVYQDVDGKDQKSLHVFGLKNDKIIVYTRIFKPGDYFKNASIGRVVVSSKERKFGFGHLLMKASIKAIEHHFKVSKITISAQVYLKKILRISWVYKDWRRLFRRRYSSYRNAKKLNNQLL